MVVIVLLPYLVVKEWLGKDGRHPDRVDPRGWRDTRTWDGDIVGHYNRAPLRREAGQHRRFALQQYVNANGEGGKEPTHDNGHPCRGLPIQQWRRPCWGKSMEYCFAEIFYCIITFTINNYLQQRWTTKIFLPRKNFLNYSSWKYCDHVLKLTIIGS